jgi:hypothetical protein
MFYNYSDEPFTYTWGGKPYTFAAGKVYPDGIIISDDGTLSVPLNEVTSRFFSKHLAEHLMNSIGKNDSATERLQNQEAYRMRYNISTMEMLTERGINPPSKEMPMPEFKQELGLIRNEAPKKDPALEVSTAPAMDVVDGKLVEPQPAKKKVGRPKKVASPSPEAVFEGV